MPRLNPDDLRRYAQRDWDAPARHARRARARQPIPDKVRMGIELYEAVRRTRPDWPDDRTRNADLASHQRVTALLRKAAHVGTG